MWHAGDWTGPKSLQPEASLSGEATHEGARQDVVALSSQGVKVIIVSMKDLHKILKGGSPLYRKYLECLKKEEADVAEKSLIDADDLSGDDIAAQWGLSTTPSSQSQYQHQQLSRHNQSQLRPGQSFGSSKASS